MNLSKPQFIILGIAGFVIIFFALVFLGVIPGLKSNLEIRVAKLTFWGVGDERGVWDTAISNYQNAYPGVQVEYTKVDSRNYEKLLLDALAAGQGPDIFMFHNSWLPKHANKIVPASPEQIQLSTFRSLFPQVAEQDFVRGDKIYGLPLSIDTLALFYNRDIFDNKRVAIVPSTWDEFKSTIPRVREISASNKLLKPAAAIGGTLKSIPEATDILNLIMLQKGTRMVSVDGSSADFHSPQGIEALNFYSQFSSPKNAYYAWNDSSTSSIDSFAGKQVAMVFAYASVTPEIKLKNPILNFDVGPAPQFNKNEAVNFANYWGLAVSAKSAHTTEAWNFVTTSATNNSVASKYLISTGKPPALRALIDEYLNSPVLGVFAVQALTARSWPQPDNVEVSGVFNNMIDSVITGKLSADKALSQAEAEVTNLIR